MTWTKFTDLQTGGYRKTAYKYIFIEGDAAVARFQAEFDHDPFQESCECCDEDFAVSTHQTLRRATDFARNCRYAGEEDRWIEAPAEDDDDVEPLDQFVARPEVRVIRCD